jgi:hypothetical protein
MAYKVPDWSYEEMAKYLKERGWELSWSDDNWVRSKAKYKEANNGTTTIAAFYLQYGMDNNLRYKVILD